MEDSMSQRNTPEKLEIGDVVSLKSNVYKPRVYMVVDEHITPPEQTQNTRVKCKWMTKKGRCYNESFNVDSLMKKECV